MSAPDPVDWGLAERVARRFAGRESLTTSYLGRSLRPDFDTVTTEAEELVAEHTGLRAPGPATAEVLDRGGWIDANLASMRRMLAPLTARMGERMNRSPIAPVGRRIAGTEMGVLLGFLAQRVLGQYDLLVPDDPDDLDGADADAVYYVGPNVLMLEKRYAFPPRDFRRWIALHEVTHRAQFTGVPWLKSHFLMLVERSLTMVDPDPRRLVQAMARAADEIRRGRNPLDDGGLVGLLASPEQRGVLAEVQSLMSLLEGHGNSVMNALGRAHVDGQERMARILQARRRARGLTGAMHKILGIDSKMRQYEVGEAFVAAIERAAGPQAIDAAWREPEALPTAEELVSPETWLARVGSETTSRL
ncbi:MAG: zinc-dependent metalloprotease [Acidimicrobiia bacterium]